MATQYPASLDAFENPAGDTSQAQVRTHSQQHSDENDAIEALEAKVGIDGSLDPESLDYKVRMLRIGGWRTVATIDDRNAIPKDQLALGMIVIVTSDQYPANNISWQLTGFDDTGAPIWTDMEAPTDAKLAALQADVDKELQDLQSNVDKDLQNLQSNVDTQLQGMQASVDETEADINKKIDNVIAGQASSAIYATDWNSGGSLPLSTLTPTFVGQGAFVPASDTGTHTDGVTGATVANAGSYTAVSVSGVLTWQWRDANALANKADKSALEDLSRKSVLSKYWRSVGKKFIFPLVTRAEVVVLGIDRDMRAWMSSARLTKSSFRHRSTRFSLGSVADTNGKLLYGANEKGHFQAKMSDNVIADVVKRAGIPLVTFRGDSTASDIFGSSSMSRARVTEGQWSFGVKQPSDGTSTVSVPDVPAPVDGIFSFGQSNAGGGGNGTPGTNTALFPHNAVMFSAGLSAYGTSATDPAALTDLASAVEPSVGSWTTIYTAFALEDIARSSGKTGSGAFCRSDWYGSQPLSSFVPGTQTWDNVMISIDRCIAVMANYGRSVNPFAVWLQGEGGPSGRDTHAAALESLIDNFRSVTQSNHGVTPHWIIWQICYSGCVESGVTLAHADVGEKHRGTDVVVAGPTYANPFLADGIHYDYTGRMMQGEVTALVVDSIKRTGTFAPLKPYRVTRDGVTVVIDFDNPGLPITFDTDWIEATNNYGFSWGDDSNSATVSSVAITGDSQVTVTLSAVPTGDNKVIRYGLEKVSPSNAKWAPYRGQLYASSGKASPFNRRGFAVPADIRFYSIAFQEISQ